MTPRTTRFRIALAITLSASVVLVRAATNETPRAPFPDGYKTWLHVKQGNSGPAGVHHIYANDLAVKGYAAGVFPEGSVLAFEVKAITTNDDKSTTEGELRRIDVMVKDAQRYKDTQGWGYETFVKGDPKAPSLSAADVAACAACHEGKKDQDRVFSVLQK